MKNERKKNQIKRKNKRKKIERKVLIASAINDNARFLSRKKLYHSHDMAMCEMYIECP